MMSMNFRNVAILNIKGADYCGITSGISKNENVYSLPKGDFKNKKKHYKT